MKYFFALLLLCSPHFAGAKLNGHAAIDSLLRELAKAKEDTNKVLLLNTIDSLYFNISPDLGIAYGNQQLALATKLGWKKGIGLANYNLGYNYKFKGEYKSALQYLYKAMGIFEEIKDIRHQGDCLMRIGVVYENEKEYTKALPIYERSLEISKETNDTLSIAKILGNISNLYEITQDYPKALDYGFRALQLCDPVKYPVGLATCLGNLGVIYIDMQKYDSALHYYQKALKIFEDLGDNAGMAINLGNIGDVYFTRVKDAPGPLDRASRTKDIKLAIEYFNKAIAIGRIIGQIEIVKSFSESLSEAYKLNGDYNAAYENYKQYAALRDSVDSKENSTLIANIEGRRELEQKEDKLRIDQLEKRNELVLLSVGIFLLLIAGGIIINKFVKQIRSNKILAEEKTKNLRQIASQTERLVAQEDILTEIAYTQSHLIRGPVATLLGLVEVMNYDDPADPNNKEIIDAIGVTATKLDTVIKDIVLKENNLRVAE